MEDGRKKGLQVCYPKWFRIFISLCGILTLSFSLFYIFATYYNGQVMAHPLRFLFFFALVLGTFWLLFGLLFYTIKATENGIESSNIVGKSTVLSWDEILEIRKPRFGIPVDFSYVISESKKMLLVRSMKNYHELIKLIENRAVNLKGKT